MIESLFAIFLIPFLSPVVQEGTDNRIIMFQSEYPIVHYQEEEYVAFEMLRIKDITIDCSSKILTVNFQYTKSITTGKILNSNNDIKTYSMDSLDFCLTQEKI